MKFTSKNLIKANLFAFIYLFFLTVAMAQSTLKGKIDNAYGIPVTYIPTVRGSFFMSGYEEIKIGNDGYFSADINTDTLAMIPFYCNRLFFRIITSPNSNDSVYVDANKPDSILFFGTNAVVNTFLNKDIKREKYFSGLLDTQTERSLVDEFYGPIVSYKVNRMRDTDLVILKRFVAKNPLDSNVQKIIFNDIRYYHAALFNSVTLNAYRMSLKEKNSPFDSTWAKTWDFAISQEKISNDDALGSYWYHDFVNVYTDWYKAAFKKEIDKTTLDIKKGENIFEMEQMLRRELKGRALEACLADLLYEEALQGLDQPALISIYNRFHKDYPKSPYHYYLAKVLAPIADKWEDKPEDLFYQEDIYLIDNQENIQTMEQLLTLFRGKVVFIDLWATWCAPCKEEFKFKMDLTKFTKGKNIEKLYISIDKEDKQKAWQDAVSFYDLGGHHIRVSPALLIDIRNRISDDKGQFTLPRYLIADKTGKIVVSNARRPSEKDALYKQIEDFLR
jgi:thiol-disulfide isomerase/thioredoxin